MALVVIHVKMYKEEQTCTGITTIPKSLCECHLIYADWSIYIAWLAALMCAVTFFLWMRLTTMLRQTAAKMSL